MPFATAVTASLQRRPSRDRNHCVMAKNHTRPESDGVSGNWLTPPGPWQARQVAKCSAAGARAWG